MPDPHFVGILKMEANPADPNTLIVASRSFAFYDEEGLEWEANRGATTDGASIPTILKPFVGHSFETPYVPGATLHDIYCQIKTRTWKRTARMFRSALICNGVSRPRAVLFWSAVYFWGPRWPDPVAPPIG